MPRRQVADPTRQFFLQVRARGREQLAIQVGDFGIAANLHG